MQTEAYVESLHEAVRILHRAEIEVFSVLARLAHAGYYNPVDAQAPESIFNIRLSEFENAEDQNLEALAHICRCLSKTRKQVIQHNSLHINLDDE